MTHGEMLDRVSAAELTQWQAYEKVAGPLGGDRDDILAALTAYYVIQALGAKRARLDKMLPDWDHRPQSWRTMQMFLKALTEAHGGSVSGSS